MPSLQIPAEMVIAMDSTTSKMDTDLSPVSAPSGSESNDNDAFDGDEMMLLPPPSTSLVPSCTVPVSVPDNPDANTLASPSKHLPLEDDAVAMDRRSRRKRTIQRLQAKNRTLKLSLAQAKADLAAERQQRAVIDQIYLKIKQDLNQKLETEEIKNANLKADLEQINQDMKELKDRTSPSGIGSYFSSSLSSRPSLGGPGSGSSGYKIGYDSSAYCASLSGGISSVGIHSSNMSLINGQDDSEEFLSSHAYSPSTSRGRSLSYSNSSLLQTVKESESEDEDMISEDGGDEHKDAVVSLSTSKGQSSLSTLMETDGEEESEDDDYGDSSDDEYSEDEADNGDAPRTMMEILLQRQKSSSPEDDVQDQPADADETYESMAQKCLRHAIRSRFTAAQTHLQLDELVIKYNPRPEQTMSAISHELVRWWETERISTGGPATIGGIFGNGPIVMKETGEQVVPKVAVEIRFQRFFAPLLLHYVASHAEQKALLDVLGHEVRTQGQQDAKLLRNHNGQLMALYKFDVVEAEAIVEWWQALELPANVFSSSDNLRSLNSRFVAWLEDEEDDSDDENTEDDSDYVDDEDEEDSEDDSDVASSDDDEADEATFDAQIQKEALDLQKDLTLVEQIVSAGALDQSSRAEDEDKDDVVPDPQQYLQDRKRRISFCASNVYYNQKGRMRTGPAYFPGGDDILDTGDSVMDVSGDPSTTSRPRKTYQQCPPFIPQLSDEEDEVENESDESTDGFIA
ncbi:hypothetical protein CPC16_010976 [Podila verticillata]|nr:hypothetical protein CPC16_010976 [Podila verticillata]